MTSMSFHIAESQGRTCALLDSCFQEDIGSRWAICLGRWHELSHTRRHPLQGLDSQCLMQILSTQQTNVSALSTALNNTSALPVIVLKGMITSSLSTWSTDITCWIYGQQMTTIDNDGLV